MDTRRIKGLGLILRTSRSQRRVHAERHYGDIVGRILCYNGTRICEQQHYYSVEAIDMHVFFNARKEKPSNAAL